MVDLVFAFAMLEDWDPRAWMGRERGDWEVWIWKWKWMWSFIRTRDRPITLAPNNSVHGEKGWDGVYPCAASLMALRVDSPARAVELNARLIEALFLEVAS